MKKLSVQLNQDYKSFKGGFNIVLEGNLIILSGVNGSGKSQLIDIISQRESHGSRKGISATIKLDDVQITRNDILHRSFKENVNVPELTHAGTESIDNHKNQAWNAYQSYRLDSNNENLWDYEESSERAKKILIEEFGEQKFNDNQITQNEIKDTLPSDFVWKSDDIFTNFIGDLFFNYALDVYDAKAKAGEIGVQFNATLLPTPPWKELNDLFSDLGFEYRFKSDYSLGKGFQISEQPSLYQIKNDGTIDEDESRKLADLSDGEKAIVSLSFASLSGVKHEDRRVLLLDEFDANFNPSLTEVFYKIVHKYFISQDILVVLATHSPTTISLAPENTTFYEVFKKNAGLSRILLVQKEDYAELKIANKEFFTKIADQFARINELQSEVEKLQKIKTEIASGTKPIIITEGKTDVQHIKKAKEKLNIANCDIEFLEMSEHWGDSKLKLLLEQLSIVPQQRKIIGIFDRDVKTIIDDIEKEAKTFKDYGNNVYAFCIPVPNERKKYMNISIEFYYKDEELKKEKGGKCLYFDNEVEQLFNKRTKKNEIRKLEQLDTSKEKEKKIFCEDIGSEDWIYSKAKFADLVENDTNFSSGFNFDNFNLVFDVIKKILKSSEKGSETAQPQPCH